jgi:hypothetical protein
MRSCSFFAILTAAIIRIAAAPATSTAETPKQIDAVLKVDRTERHPGETLLLTGAIKNASPADRMLPTNSLVWPFAFATLHVRLPNGDECTYDPYADSPLRSSFTALRPPSFAAKLVTGKELNLFQKSLRLTDGLSGWRLNKQTGGLSLRAPGKYEFWFEYRVANVPAAAPEAWMGELKSNTAEIVVADLQPDKMRPALTAEQQTALDKLVHGPLNSTTGLEFLERQVLLAENEPLAERLVALALEDSQRNVEYMRLVSLRACTPDTEKGLNGSLLLGLDGAYLKTAALAVINALERFKPDDAHSRALLSGYGTDVAIAYLRFHSDDVDSRERLVKLAKQSARVPPVRDRQQHVAGGPLPPAAGPMSTSVAWSVLMELGVLHAGMSIDETTAILGEPTGRTKDSLTWYLASPRHVNPGLSAKLKNGKIVAFSRYSG